MIDYTKVQRGDILRLVGEGAPGFGMLGDLMRVLNRTEHGVLCENKRGQQIEFVFNCGAARLEPTEWRNDFLDQEPEREKVVTLTNACGATIDVTVVDVEAEQTLQIETIPDGESRNFEANTRHEVRFRRVPITLAESEAAK